MSRPHVGLVHRTVRYHSAVEARSSAVRAGLIARPHMVAPIRGHLTFRFSADDFPRLLTISYSTCWPSLSVLRPAFSTAEIWTKTSPPPPPWGWMKPYPFAGLN